MSVLDPSRGADGFVFPNPNAWLRVLSQNNIGVFVINAAPSNGSSGTGVNILGTGALLIDNVNGILYMNTGTLSSPTWTAIAPVAGGLALPSGDILVGNSGGKAAAVAMTGDVAITNAGVTTVQPGAITSGKIAANAIGSGQLSTSLLQYASGTISSANITGTSAGQLGNAAGAILIPAPGAGFSLQLEAVGLYYTFATAAYTGGGVVGIAWGSGGAAVTGTATYANSIGASANKANMFTLLSTAAIALVSNASLNLTVASAPTQPGTAAGTIAWEAWYRIMTVGF